MKNINKIDYILQHINSLLTRDSDQILLEQLGVGYSQYKILRVVEHNVPFKQSFIANLIGQTEASISRQIDILMIKKLIIKKVDPNNKRIRLITITPRGKKIKDEANKILESYYGKALIGFNSKKQIELLKLLEDFHDKICSVGHVSDHDYLDYLTNN